MQVATGSAARSATDQAGCQGNVTVPTVPSAGPGCHSRRWASGLQEVLRPLDGGQCCGLMSFRLEDLTVRVSGKCHSLGGVTERHTQNGSQAGCYPGQQDVTAALHGGLADLESGGVCFYPTLGDSHGNVENVASLDLGLTPQPQTDIVYKLLNQLKMFQKRGEKKALDLQRYT